VPPQPKRPRFGQLKSVVERLSDYHFSIVAADWSKLDPTEGIAFGHRGFIFAGDSVGDALTRTDHAAA
jgi:hypothetical protein